jgi:hypothetical protein
MSWAYLYRAIGPLRSHHSHSQPLPSAHSLSRRPSTFSSLFRSSGSHINQGSLEELSTRLWSSHAHLNPRSIVRADPTASHSPSSSSFTCTPPRLHPKTSYSAPVPLERPTAEVNGAIRSAKRSATRSVDLNHGQAVLLVRRFPLFASGPLPSPPSPYDRSLPPTPINEAPSPPFLLRTPCHAVP